MARHETEMHRQRRELIEAMRKIQAEAKYWDSDNITTLRWQLGNIWHLAEGAIRAVQPPCDHGLFGERGQLDLADRKDC